MSNQPPSDQESVNLEEEEDGIPEFQINAWDQDMIQRKLIEGIQAAIRVRKLDAEGLMRLGAFLWLVEHFPEHHEEYTGSLDLELSHENGRGWRSVSFSEDEGFNIGGGESYYGEFGSDHSSHTIYSASTTKPSDRDDFIDLEDWLSEFARDMGDPEYGVSVEWNSEGEKEIPGFT